MKLKVFVLSVVLLLSAGMAMAQYTYPVNPNPTKFQTTFYSNDQFLATFNSSVTVTIEQKNTSTDTIYQSFNHGVVQAISVRIIDHDIPVDVSSSDFYMNNDPLDTPITVHSTGTWGGRPFTYAYRQFTFSGSVFSKRTRAIIVNAREVIFVTQIAAMSYDDQNEWFDFEYSLRVR
jgi:hypothetical protein